MSAIIPLRPAPARPLNVFIQIYTNAGEPYVFAAERWRTEDVPPGVEAIPHPLLPGCSVAGHVYRARTGETITPDSAALDVTRATG